MAKMKLKKNEKDESVEVEANEVALSVEELEGGNDDVILPETVESVPEVISTDSPKLVEVAAQVIEGVKVTMLREVSPAPVVGKYNVARELKVAKLEAGKSYRLPSDVAMVLVDSNSAVLSH